MDRAALARATESTDAPTPGYLYVDIAKSAASSPAACSEIVTYLTRRLASKNNHNVKYKCLKVIQQVSSNPVTRGQFKRAVVQDPSAVSAIKDALQFRGPPDPARGDEVYRRVQEAAKECLDAVYADGGIADGRSSANAGLGGGGSMEGFGGGAMGGVAGSGSHIGAAGGYGSPAGGYGGAPPPPNSGVAGVGAPGSAAAPGARRMEGVGNPMYKDPRANGSGGVSRGIGDMTVGEVASELGSAVIGMIKDPLAKNVDVGSHQPRGIPSSYGGRGSYGGASGGYGAPPGANQLSQATGGQWTMASNRGPNAVVPPANLNSERDEAYFKARDSGSNAYQWAKQGSGAPGGGGVGGSWGASAGNPSMASRVGALPPPGATPVGGRPPAGGAGGVSASDGSYERNLVMELCPPGGMRPEPPQDKLDAFANAIPSLDSDLICPVLLDCLEDGQPWIIKAKALCAIERTIQVADEQGIAAYSDFFHECAAEIEPLALHPRSAIKEPARRVMKLLGMDVKRAGSSAGVATATVAGAAAAQQAAAAQPDPAIDLLGFDDATPTPSTPAAAAPEVGAPASAPPPPSEAPPVNPPVSLRAEKGGGSLFGGLNVQGAVEAPPPPPSPPDVVAPAPLAADGSGFEVLLGEAPAPAAPSSTTIAGVSASAPSAAAASGGGGSSLFGDMAVKENKPNEVNAPSSGQAKEELPAGAAEVAAPSGSAFGFMNTAAPPTGPGAGDVSKPLPSPSSPGGKASFDPLLSMGAPVSAQPMQQQNAAMANVQMAQQAAAYQQNMLMMQQQMQRMQMAMSYQQGGAGGSQGSAGGAAVGAHPMNMNVMASNASNAMKSGSLMFVDDKKKENPEFDFIKDAMKGAR